MASEATRQLFVQNGSPIVVPVHDVVGSEVVSGVIIAGESYKPAVLAHLKQSDGTYVDVVFTDPHVLCHLTHLLLGTV